MRALFAALAGLIFGVGLTISEMVNPAKVLAFLDVFSGAWDPSLMFVMGAGVVVYAVGYQLIIRRNAPLVAPSFSLPTANQIDPPLIGGAVLFGAGWGLVGLCPGPAFSALALGGAPVLIFMAAVVAGMLTFEWLWTPLQNRASA